MNLRNIDKGAVFTYCSNNTDSNNEKSIPFNIFNCVGSTTTTTSTTAASKRIEFNDRKSMHYNKLLMNRNEWIVSGSI